MPNQMSAAPALGSDESLGGALLTPIPWLSPIRDLQAQRVAQANNDRELQRESTEIVDGPNGAGRIETVSVVNGVMTTVYSHAPLPSQTSSSASPQQSAHSTEQTLRAEGAVTQGELLRQEQEAGVVPVSPRRLRMTEEEMRIMDADEQDEDDEDDEKPHARGPEEIGMEDTGPQERPSGHGLDMEHAVGRHKRESSVEREISPQEASLPAATKEEVMKDTEEEEEDVDEEKKDKKGKDEDVEIEDAVEAVKVEGETTEVEEKTE
jgi:hypothetical protein